MPFLFLFRRIRSDFPDLLEEKVGPSSFFESVGVIPNSRFGSSFPPPLNLILSLFVFFSLNADPLHWDHFI